MGRFENEAGVVVSVADSKDDRFTPELGWKPAGAAKPAEKNAPAAKQDDKK